MTKRKAEPTGLSRDTICTAALDLIEHDGLAAFSTRKLGRVLGCEAMAIYYYYPSKDALLDAVVDKLMASIQLTTEGGWIAALREVAHAYRRLAHEHPNAFPLLGTRRFSSEGAYGFLEQLFELGHRLGIEDRVAAKFYRVVSSYCNGFALNELATPPHQTSAQRKRFPRTAAALAWIEPRYLDEMFTFGLELQLEALRRVTVSG
jgi:AcrR family transcriptional regulator